MSPAARLRRRVGRRGASLLCLGLFDLVYCYGLAFPPPRAAWSPGMKFLADILPLWAWAIPWGAVGALCLCRSIRRRDAAAFAGAIGVKVLWAAASVAGWLFGNVDRGYTSVVVWLMFAAFVGIIASWPEPVDTKGRPTWTPPLS